MKTLLLALALLFFIPSAFAAEVYKSGQTSYISYDDGSTGTAYTTGHGGSGSTTYISNSDGSTATAYQSGSTTYVY